MCVWFVCLFFVFMLIVVVKRFEPRFQGERRSTNPLDDDDEEEEEEGLNTICQITRKNLTHH